MCDYNSIRIKYITSFIRIMSQPYLVDPSFHNYMNGSLFACHTTRLNLYYYILNLGILLVFVIIFGYALYCCNTQKLSDYDKQQKLLQDQQYVLSKVRYYKQEMAQKEDNINRITNLPDLEHF